MHKIGILNVGSEGEQFIQRELYNHFPASRILRNVYLKKSNGDYTEIDLLAIDYCGIFVFESKNFSGMIFGSQEDKDWTQVQRKNKRTFYNPIKQNTSHINALKLNLKQYPQIQFYNFVVFSGTGKMKVNPISLPNTYVVDLKELGNVIRDLRDAAEAKGALIPSSQRKEIADLLSQTSRPGKAIKDLHLKQIKKTASKCPICKNALIERTNKTNGNKFYGCKSFPKCKFTKPI